MPIWLLEVFGMKELNRLFWVATASSAPFWTMMALFPRARLTRSLCKPWIVPPVLGIIFIYLLYLAWTVTGLPKLDGVEMTEMRRFWNHPILFIALWLHRLVLDLFVGINMYRYSRYNNWNITLELILTWLFGPIGMMAFAIRYGISEWRK